MRRPKLLLFVSVCVVWCVHYDLHTLHLSHIPQIAECDRYAKDDACRVLVLNKCDLVNASAADKARAMATTLSLPFFETSAKNSTVRRP